MERILNYIKINELIATSGQIKSDEFNLLKENDFEVVINLALSSATNALENEDKIVTQLGMSYFHIPVDWENPKIEQLKLFINTLQALGANKIWIHCAKNYRVTAFMYVYHKFVLKTPFEEIDLSILNKWNPSEKWQELMQITLEELVKP